MDALAIDNVLFLLTAVAASVAITILLMQVFSERPLSRSKDSPSSHFKLRELVQRSRLSWIALTCSLPFALLFLVLSVKSSTLVTAAKSLLTSKILGLLEPTIANKVESVLQSIPSWLDPLFVLVASLVLFAPYIRAPFDFFRSQVFAVIGIDEDADDTAEEAAKAVLYRYGQDFTAAGEELLKITESRDAPLPEELADEPAVKRMAFQLVYFARDETGKRGLVSSLSSLMSKLDARASFSDSRDSLGLSHVFAALTFYAVLCASYALLAPMIAPWLHTGLVRGMLQQVEWPAYSGELALSLLQRTLSFIVPLAGGIALYSVRRKDHQHESSLQAFAFVVSIQFLFSFLVNGSFAILSVAQRATGETGGQVLSLASVKIWADAFVFSLTPAVALFSWIVAGRYKLGRASSAATVCFAAAVAFCLCQFLYERLAANVTGFYWHQLIFGAFITLSYGLSALIASDVLPTIDHVAAKLRTPGPPRTA
jgi:hypothetical protein